MSDNFLKDLFIDDVKGCINQTAYTDKKVSELNKELDKKADKEKYGDTVVSVGRKADSTVGENSFAFGEDVTASGRYCHAEGNNTTADGYATHAEGEGTTALSTYSHAEGNNTTAKGSSCHAEGGSTTADVYGSHAEGYGTTAGSAYSHAEGKETTASGQASHSEGDETTASGIGSHAEGGYTTASGQASHSEGAMTTASGYRSHAEGDGTTASGSGSHAEGISTTASGDISHAEGYGTKSLDNQHAQGHYNNTTTATSNSFNGTSTGTAFVIGNGTESSPSNAFRVTGEGVMYATNAAVQTGADYAEYFEWSDGNPDNEDRVGLFVTFDEDNPEKIRIANSNDDYILGIVSGMPSVIGNGDEDWKKRFILDDFGRYIQETFEYVENEETKTGTKWKENPEYDNTKPYTPRDERAEWSAIGLVGVLSVYDDGTCQVNGYCKCKNNGIATAVEKGVDTYRVIKRVSDNIVKVVLK